jgi:hypothetical protein
MKEALYGTRYKISQPANRALASLSLITHKHATVETMTALVHNSPLLLTFGMVFLTAGLAIVLGHNVWSGGALPVVVTVVGWLLLIRGLILLFLSPEAAVGIFAGLHFEHLFYLYFAVSLTVGVYLTYGGFSSRSGSHFGFEIRL